MIAAVAACVLGATASSALAGQVGTTWVEREDAGPKPANAQATIGSGPLTAIRGVANFNANMFRICAGPDFSASTENMADFDTQLFLFDKRGVGLYATDDGVDLQSSLPSGHPNGPNIRSEYFIAISPFDRDPVDVSVARDSKLIFPTFPFEGVYGRFTDTGPISGWQGVSNGDGNYTIELTGAEFLNRNGRCTRQSSMPLGAERIGKP